MSTVTKDDRITGPLTPAAAVTVLSSDFPVLDKHDISVLKEDVNGVFSTLVLDTDFAVSDFDNDLGATVTLTVGANGTDKYWLVGAMNPVRLLNYLYQKAFNSADSNTEFKRLWMAINELRRLTGDGEAAISGRVLVKPGTGDVPLGNAIAGEALVWDATGTKLESSNLTGAPGMAVDWQGDWALAVAYTKATGAAGAMGVSHNSSSYICILDHTSAAANEPGVGVSWTTYWQVSALQGAKGQTGPVVGIWFDTHADFLADATLAYGAGTGDVATGDLINSKAEGYGYEVAASGAGDNDYVTAGGVKVYETGRIFTSLARFKAAVARLGAYPVAATVTVNGDLYRFDNDGNTNEAGLTGWNRLTDVANFPVRTNQLTAFELMQIAQNPLATDALGLSGLYPTSTNVIAAIRLDQYHMLVRCRSTTLAAAGDAVYYDEFIYKYSDGTFPPSDPVPSGWHLWAKKCFAKGRVQTWVQGTADPADMPNLNFALRLGDITVTYVSGGEGPDWYYCGFGHGRMNNVHANNQIFVDGGGTNLNDIANWAAGVKKYGTTIQISQQFLMHHPSFGAGATDIVQVDTTDLMGDYGLKDIGSFQALVANVGFNDSYVLMDGGSPPWATHMKPGGETAVQLLRDGVQKGNWTTTTATDYQAYFVDDPTLVSTVSLAYGQPVRKQGGGLAAWGLNSFSRAFVLDNTDFSKWYVAGASSEEALPRTAWALPVGTVYEWQNYHRTKYLAGGPV